MHGGADEPFGVGDGGPGGEAHPNAAAGDASGHATTDVGPTVALVVPRLTAALAAGPRESPPGKLPILDAKEHEADELRCCPRPRYPEGHRSEWAEPTARDRRSGQSRRGRDEPDEEREGDRQPARPCGGLIHAEEAGLQDGRGTRPVHHFPPFEREY